MPRARRAPLARQQRAIIQARMKALRLSVSGLARLAKVQRQNLSSFLNETRNNPSTDWLDLIHAALDKETRKQRRQQRSLDDEIDPKCCRPKPVPRFPEQ